MPRKMSISISSNIVQGPFVVTVLVVAVILLLTGLLLAGLLPIMLLISVLSFIFLCLVILIASISGTLEVQHGKIIVVLEHD